MPQFLIQNSNLPDSGMEYGIGKIDGRDVSFNLFSSAVSVSIPEGSSADVTANQ